MPVENVTANRGYKEPHASNKLKDDVARLVLALRDIDVDVATALELIAQRATIASPAFSGAPTAPTPSANDNSTKIATTAFVRGQFADFIGAAPESLDTLGELAEALQNNPDIIDNLLEAIGGKLAKADSLSDLPDAGEARDNLDVHAKADVVALIAAAAAERLAKDSNLSDLASVATARTNLDVYSKSEATGLTHAATAKATPADADEFGFQDSVASWTRKKLTWANIKALLVPVGRKVEGAKSLAGGGALSADRTIELVGDEADPGASKCYGTDAAGVRGFYPKFGPYTWAAEQAMTSGTAKDFTGIPAWVSEIIVVLKKASLSGTDNFLIQIGTSGGVETSDYHGGYANGFNGYGGTSSNQYIVVARLTRGPDNLWIYDAAATSSAGGATVITGYKQLSAALDRVRVTRSGSNTLDDGSGLVGWR